MGAHRKEFDSGRRTSNAHRNWSAGADTIAGYNGAQPDTEVTTNLENAKNYSPQMKAG
jgi:hypothetical protein